MGSLSPNKNPFDFLGLDPLGKKIGGIFGLGKDKKDTPVPAPVIKAASPQPTPASPKVKAAGQKQRNRARAALGRPSTVLTSGQGLLTDATTAKKTLLGV